MLRTLKPMSIHLGLPCGTCSRARERALPSTLQNNFKAPQQLRDATHLLGFPWLAGDDLRKVQSANLLYKFAVQLLFVCWELGIYPSIENPTRSWLWGVLVLLVTKLGNDDFTRWFANLRKTSFHACMHGSQRNKQTSLLAPSELFDELEAECDRSHPHLAWEIKPIGKRLSFATAKEAAYPVLLCSRMADLSRAYKQLAIDEKSRRLSVVGFYHLDCWKYFLNDALPFGSTASVYSFNRVSKSLHHILCKLLFALSTCFYDDFPTISPKASASILTKSLSAVLNILGWDHAQVGVKAVDFASDFNALGISVCLKQLHRGSFVMANKAGRIERICSMLRKVEPEGFISKNMAAEIQGHLNFAAGFFTSRALHFLVSSFARLADIPKCLIKGDLHLLCGLAINMLEAIPPRTFKANTMKNPLLTFTDGAWEDGQASAGAVVFDPDCNKLSCFEIAVPNELVRLWVSETGDQIISQIEIFAMLAVRYKLSHRLLNRTGKSWIDNESAKYACIKGTSTSFSMQVLCRVLQQIELESPSSIWYERVASYSNPGDLPSRRQSERASKIYNAISEAVWVPPSCIGEAITSLHHKPFGVLHTLLTGEQTSATNTKHG